MGGNHRGGDQFGRWGQDPDRGPNGAQNGVQDGADQETATISPQALILVGVSMLALLAGLVIAFKVKH